MTVTGTERPSAVNTLVIPTFRPTMFFISFSPLKSTDPGVSLLSSHPRQNTAGDADHNRQIIATNALRVKPGAGSSPRSLASLVRLGQDQTRSWGYALRRRRQR